MAEEYLDAGDAKQVEKIKKQSKQNALQRKETLKRLMSDENNRKWIYDVLAICGMGHNPFSSDALLMAHSCGEMNIGLRIRSDIETAAPEFYLLMMRENNDG